MNFQQKLPELAAHRGRRPQQTRQQRGPSLQLGAAEGAADGAVPAASKLLHAPGTQFNRNSFGLSFSLKNHQGWVVS